MHLQVIKLFKNSTTYWLGDISDLLQVTRFSFSHSTHEARTTKRMKKFKWNLSLSFFCYNTMYCSECCCWYSDIFFSATSKKGYVNVSLIVITRLLHFIRCKNVHYLLLLIFNQWSNSYIILKLNIWFAKEKLQQLESKPFKKMNYDIKVYICFISFNHFMLTMVDKHFHFLFSLVQIFLQQDIIFMFCFWSLIIWHIYKQLLHYEMDRVQQLF